MAPTILLMCTYFHLATGPAGGCRGTVIGILKAFLGLSASAYITIYVSFIEPDAIRFLRILALAPTAVALVSAFFINYVPFIQIEPHTKARPPFAYPPVVLDRSGLKSLNLHPNDTMLSFA